MKTWETVEDASHLIILEAVVFALSMKEQQWREQFTNMCFYRKLLGKLGTQKTRNLLVERTEEVPPFTHYGTDVFGQYIIRVTRSDLKRYCFIYVFI